MLRPGGRGPLELEAALLAAPTDARAGGAAAAAEGSGEASRAESYRLVHSTLGAPSVPPTYAMGPSYLLSSAILKRYEAANP